METPIEIIPEREKLVDVPVVINTENHSVHSSERWHLMGTNIPKSEIVYFSQMLIVYIIIITSIVNLSLSNGPSELWISLLSSCIGYSLPSPKLKK